MRVLDTEQEVVDSFKVGRFTNKQLFKHALETTAVKILRKSQKIGVLEPAFFCKMRYLDANTTSPFEEISKIFRVAVLKKTFEQLRPIISSIHFRRRKAHYNFFCLYWTLWKTLNESSIVNLATSSPLARNSPRSELHHWDFYGHSGILRSDIFLK